MPKKTKLTTPGSTEIVSTSNTTTTGVKKAQKKATTTKPTTEIVSESLPVKEQTKKAVQKKPRVVKSTEQKEVSIQPTIVQEKTVSEPVEKATKQFIGKKRPQRSNSKKPTSLVSEENIVIVEPIQQSHQTVTTTSNETTVETQKAPTKKPFHKNQRNNRQRNQQNNTKPPIEQVLDANEDKPNEQVIVAPLVSTNEEAPEQVLPRKKNKKKKKSKAKSTETTIAVDIPVEQPLPVESQQQTAPHKQPQKAQQKKQPPIQREVKKLKPKLPLNDKSKKLFSYLTPLAKDFVKKVYASIVAVIPSIEHENLMVCVSGGKDSVVLLDALWYISGMIPMKIIIAHCNHNLRGDESDQDEQFVRHLGKKYSIPTFCTSANVSAYSKKYKQSIELAARNLRYKFFERLAKEQSVPYILTAHTKDDTVETMLFNLVRGTGIKGITGIPKKRELDQNITVYRPMIPITRQEISEYADERQLEWREDSSNTNLSYTRNKIRHKLLPLLKEEFNPSVLDTLYRFAEFAKGAESLVAKNVETYLPHVLTKKTNTSLTIHLESFKAISLFLKGEILLRSIKSHFEISLNLLQIEGILQLSEKETGARFIINEQLHVVKERNELIITNHHRFKEAPQFIQKTGKFNFGEWTLTLEKVARQSAEFTNDPNVEYLDEDTLPALLILRHWEHGDKFAPIGMFGLEQNVSDYLTNAKIAHLERETVVVLASTTRIFWVCGHRLSESCKVTDATINVIKATFIKRSDKK